MNARFLILFLSLSLVIVTGCSNNAEKQLEHLNGYWEINQVKKGNKLVKEFGINTVVDYFELTDSVSGFRKKVAPTLDGKFMVNESQVSFIMKVERDSLNIYYHLDDVQTKETVLKLNETELVIANSQGFKYFYKPFEPLNLDDE